MILGRIPLPTLLHEPLEAAPGLELLVLGQQLHLPLLALLQIVRLLP